MMYIDKLLYQTHERKIFQLESLSFYRVLLMYDQPEKCLEELNNLVNNRHTLYDSSTVASELFHKQIQGIKNTLLQHIKIENNIP